MEEANAQEGVKRGLTTFCCNHGEHNRRVQRRQRKRGCGWRCKYEHAPPVFVRPGVRRSPATASINTTERKPLLHETQWWTCDPVQLQARSETCAPQPLLPKTSAAKGRASAAGGGQTTTRLQYFSSALVTRLVASHAPHTTLCRLRSRGPTGEPAIETGRKVNTVWILSKMHHGGLNQSAGPDKRLLAEEVETVSHRQYVVGPRRPGDRQPSDPSRSATTKRPADAWLLTQRTESQRGCCRSQRSHRTILALPLNSRL